MIRKCSLHIVIALLIVAAGGVGYLRFFNTANEEQADSAPSLGTGAEATRIRPADTALGQIKAAGNIRLTEIIRAVVKVDGFVEDVLVEVGAAVSSGDLLVALERDDLERALEEARIDLASAELKLQELLLNDADGTEIELEQLNVEMAQLDLQRAEADLAGAQLIAMTDGSVLSVDVAEGVKVSPGTVAVTLADLSQLELLANVAEVDIPKISIGQLMEVTIDAFPGEMFAGVVSHIDPSSSSQQGIVNYPVTIRLTDGPLDDALPGMTAVATLKSDMASDRWLVPTAAIQEDNGESVVTVVRGEQQMLVPVKTEAVQGVWTVVRSGQLQSGDEVLGGTAPFAGG